MYRYTQFHRWPGVVGRTWRIPSIAWRTFSFVMVCVKDSLGGKVINLELHPLGFRRWRAGLGIAIDPDQNFLE